LAGAGEGEGEGAERVGAAVAGAAAGAAEAIAYSRAAACWGPDAGDPADPGPGGVNCAASVCCTAGTVPRLQSGPSEAPVEGTGLDVTGMDGAGMDDGTWAVAGS